MAIVLFARTEIFLSEMYLDKRLQKMAKDFSLLIKAFEEARDALDAVLPDVATAVSLPAKAYSQRTIMDRGFGET